MMKINKLHNNAINNKDLSCDRILLYGFLIRLILLVLMLTFFKSFTQPYFIADDIKYEETVSAYMRTASSVFDVSKLNSIADWYIAPFWPWVACISAYIFRSVYAGRFINVILSTLCIKVIYNLVFNISDSKKSASIAAKLFAFLPVTVITCCFPIKDIFITFAVLYVFNIFVCLKRNIKISLLRLILCIGMMVAIYFSRGAVMELLLVFFFSFYLKKFIENKNYWAAFFITIISVGIFIVFKDAILGSFETKIDDYGGSSADEGGIAFLSINSVTDIYRLPFTYFFATLQPIKLNLFTHSSLSVWHNIISHLNISIYPVAIANFLYACEKKHDSMFWTLTFIMYSAVIILSLGVFRHYLFLLPLQIINCSLYFEESNNNKIKIVTICSLGLLLLIFLYTIMLAA